MITNDVCNVLACRTDARPLPLNSISVIVPCAGWPDTLVACLRSLVAQSVDLPVEIVIVVNGPDVSVAPPSWPSARIVYEPVHGPAAARNSGVLAATGDVLAFTDSDCIANSEWLASALRVMRDGAAGSVIAGAITRSGSRRNAISLYDSVMFLQQEAYVKCAGGFVTANLVVHRSIFERVGPFDPVFTEAAFEDWDWAMRAQEAGIPVRYEAGTVVDHPCISRFRELRAKSERLARGEIVFGRKHGENLCQRNLLDMIRDHVRRVWHKGGMSVIDRLCLAGVGAIAGFWRWNAFNGMLRDKMRIPG